MKSSLNVRKLPLKIAFSLISIALLIILVAFSPAAKGQDNQLYIQLTPASGPTGTAVSVYGLGFSGGTVTISFNSQQVGSAYPGMFGRINGIFMVPSVSQGTYTVTATTSQGNAVTSSFTVTAQGSTSGPGTGTSTGTTTGTNTGTTTGTNTGTGAPSGVASITLSVSSGIVGKPVTVKGSGFGAGTFVTINFASTYVAATTADSSGKINIGFTVPMENPGFYTVSATTSTGVFASQAFTVTTGTSGSSATNQNSGTGSEGFWTALNTLAVGLVVAAAIIIPVTFIFIRRGRNEPLVEQEQPLVQPQAPSFNRAPPPASTYNKPGSIASRYDQFASYGHPSSHGPQASRPYSSTSRPSGSSSSYSAYNSQATRRPTASANYGQPSRSNPQQSNTTICRNCRQTVRADYNTCPYCRKKIR